MKTLLPTALLASLLAGCVIDDSDTPGYYGRSPYYDDGDRYDHYERSRYGYRYERDRWDDADRYRDGYDRGYRDARRDEDRLRHDDRRDDRRHRGTAQPGEFTAGGAAKEYAFPTGHRRCTIKITDGSVGFRTIVVRRGGAKQSITVNATLQRGQTYDVPIDEKATGIRISDTGRGRYRVSVK